MDLQTATKLAYFGAIVQAIVAAFNFTIYRSGLIDYSADMSLVKILGVVSFASQMFFYVALIMFFHNLLSRQAKNG